MIPEFVTHGDAMFPFVRGTGGLKAGIGAFKKAFPDARLSVEHIFGEDDKVVARVQVTGTHRGEWLGVGADQCRDGLDVIVDHPVQRGGMMAERWVIEDELAMLEQLGIIKAVGADRARPPRRPPATPRLRRLPTDRTKGAADSTPGGGHHAG